MSNVPVRGLKPNGASVYVPDPAIGDAFALKAGRTLGDSLLTGINPQEGKGRPSTRQRTV